MRGICSLIGDMNLNKEWEIQNNTLLIRIQYSGTRRRKGVNYLLPVGEMLLRRITELSSEQVQILAVRKGG